jgi:dipeptidyl aminopeptidase/acylaminoacyl peptidase
MRWLMLALLVVSTGWSISCSREEDDDATTSSPRAPQTFPERPAAQAIEGGIQFVDVALKGTGPGRTMRLWVYLPKGNHAPKSLPCVLVAPAGSNTVTGMTLGDGDQPEHLPYVKAGFAVVAYELDGAVPGGDESEAAMRRAVAKFVEARGGVLNAATAIDYVAARVPEIDGRRTYAAGHSSAGTVALTLAAHDRRVMACVAYAPATNLRDRLGFGGTAALDEAVPGAEKFVDWASPHANVERLKKRPVMLFVARDDTTVRPDTVSSFYHTLQEAGAPVVHLKVAD